MTRAILYTRDADGGADIARQRDALRAEVSERGWDVVGEYSDTTPIPTKTASGGFTMERPGFDAVVEELRAGRADVLMAEDMDHLLRKDSDAAEIRSAWKVSGATVVTLPAAD